MIDSKRYTDSPRVAHVKNYSTRGQNGYYTTFAKSADHYLKPLATTRPAVLSNTPATKPEIELKVVPPVPDVVISEGWLYVIGDAPCVGTTAVVAQATGCKLLLYRFQPPNSSTWFHRVCYLEGDLNDLVWLAPWTATAVQDLSIYLTAGTFADVDVQLAGNPAFERFDGWRVQTGTGQVVRPIEDLENDPKHQSVMNEVNDACQAGGIP